MDTLRISDIDPEQLDLSLLPPQMRDIIKTVGVTDAFKLLEFRGGRRLYVPEAATENCQLANVISMDGLQKLVARYGGSELHLPKMDKVFMQFKHRLMREMKVELPAAAIAAALNCSERRVYQITSTTNTDRNLDLFGQ